MSKPRPEGDILRVLQGETVEVHDVNSLKPGTSGDASTVKLVESGSGMVGLREAKENQEWSGIFNHIMTTARLATFLAQKMKEAGVVIDPGIVLNTILVSHSGRRQWDEAKWYPDSVPDAEKKAKMGDTKISLELLANAGISPTIIENVSAHDVFKEGDIDHTLNTPEKEVALYADYRTSQNIMPLEQRVADLQRAVDQGRITAQQLEQIKTWSQAVEQRIFSKLNNSAGTGKITAEMINDNFPPAPRWERYIRRLYVQDAEGEIFKKIGEYEQKIADAETEADHQTLELAMEKDFPKSTWWGRYVRDLYIKQRGVPKLKRKKGEFGVARAQAFFGSLDHDKIKKLYQEDN